MHTSPGEFSLYVESPCALVQRDSREFVRHEHTVLGMSAAEEAARMPKRTRKHIVRKIVLPLPGLGHAKTSVLNSLSSPRSRRNYKGPLGYR
jgi:hypothetical protein